MSDLVRLGESISLWAVGMVVWLPLYPSGGVRAPVVLRCLIRALIAKLPRISAAASTPVTVRRAAGPSERSSVDCRGAPTTRGQL